MNIKDERGYALISVLTIVIIITAFAMILIPKTLNTSLQVNQSEGNSQGKDLSEMGIKYTHAYLQNLVTKAINDAKADSRFNLYSTNRDELFCEKLKTRLTTFKTVDGYNRSILPATANYNIKINNHELVRFNPSTISFNNTTCTGFKSLIIPIQSIGKANGKKEKTIKANFVIENRAGDTPGRIIGGKIDPNNLFFEEKNYFPQVTGNSVANLLGSVKFNVQVDIKGNSTLKLGGDAWFNSNTDPSIKFAGSDSTLLVAGNAFFTKAVTFSGNSNNICIRKNAYLLTDGEWKVYDAAKQNCPYKDEPVPYYYDIDGWGIFENNLNVIY